MFLFKMMPVMERFQEGLKFLLIFPQVISDYGFVKIHPCFFPSIHGNQNGISLKGLMGQLREASLGVKSAGPFDVLVSTASLLRMLTQ